MSRRWYFSALAIIVAVLTFLYVLDVPEARDTDTLLFVYPFAMAAIFGTLALVLMVVTARPSERLVWWRVWRWHKIFDPLERALFLFIFGVTGYCWVLYGRVSIVFTVPESWFDYFRGSLFVGSLAGLPIIVHLLRVSWQDNPPSARIRSARIISAASAILGTIGVYLSGHGQWLAWAMLIFAATFLPVVYYRNRKELHQ